MAPSFHCSIWTAGLINLLHNRWVFCMKKVWGRRTAVILAKGLSLSTAAPGSKLAMLLVTLQGTVATNKNSLMCVLSFVLMSNFKFWCTFWLPFICLSICVLAPSCYRGINQCFFSWLYLGILVLVLCVLFTCSAPMDTNLLSNIHKLFSERIDIFSSVEFNKVSVDLQVVHRESQKLCTGKIFLFEIFT